MAYIDLMEYNNAFEYLEGALKIYKEVNNKVNEALTLNNIGYTHLKLKKYEDAYLYYEKAKKINLEVENKRGLCTSYLGIARMYTNQKKYDNALVYALKSEKIADELDMIKFKRDASELLSKIYNNTNDYKKAFTSHQQFKILNDSLFNKNNIEKIAQLEYEYKYKQALDSASIRELQLTKTVKTTSENLEKTQRNLLLGVIGFLLIALLMGAIIFIQKLRNVQTKTQNIIVEQKLLRSQMTPHFIFNSLSVLQGMILNKEEKTSVSYLAKFSKLLRTILENSRHKTVVLSEELSAIDSYMALQNLDVTPPFKYKLTIDPKIDKSALKIPPMLIQPFIENAIEHAFPNKKENKEISIDLTFVDNKLVCKVLDNGVGINIENKTANRNKSSLATKITAERLQMLSKEFSTEGSVTIQNRKEFGKQGTLVTLVIPYKN